jgi:hypothetical protein
VVEGGGLETCSNVSTRKLRRLKTMQARNQRFRGLSFRTPGDRRGHHGVCEVYTVCTPR